MIATFSYFFVYLQIYIMYVYICIYIYICVCVYYNDKNFAFHEFIDMIGAYVYIIG